MLTVDFVGLLFTVCLIGLRYPLPALGAVAVHELGRVLMVLFFNGRIEAVLAAGAFGTAAVGGLKAGWPMIVVAFGGPLANYLVAFSLAGSPWKNTDDLFHLAATLKEPFPVVNLRLALLSTIITIWQLI